MYNEAEEFHGKNRGAHCTRIPDKIGYFLGDLWYSMPFISVASDKYSSLITNTP